MRIPFTVPQLPEINLLHLNDRKHVLKKYAESKAAQHLIRVFKVQMFVAILSFMLAFILHDILRIIFIGIGGILVIIGIITYRICATRAIRRILQDFPPRDTDQNVQADI